MRWKIPNYSKSQIIRAGKVIKDPSNYTRDEINHYREVIDNWRASHAFPLNVIYCNLKRNFASSSKNIIVAQRLKRLDSIENKLKREPTMSLWTMQDIGGCRVIAPTVNDVYNVISKFKKSHIRHKLKKEYDYIHNPKPSGYRSYHMVYEYYSDNRKTYNKNMLIEIQVRTRLQHLWATALETIGLFTNQALKASMGDCETLRFFTLLSSCFAIEEKRPLVPNTPDNINEIKKELISIEKKNNLLDMLGAIRVAVDFVDQKNSDTTKLTNGYFILILNYEKRHLSLRYFKTSEIEQATTIYNKIELDKKGKTIDAVLVSVSSFKKLRYAYPNYFVDLKKFITIVKNIIEN